MDCFRKLLANKIVRKLQHKCMTELSDNKEISDGHS